MPGSVGRAHERRARLARAAIFGRLGEAELDALARTACPVRLAAREVLFHRGDEGSCLYLVESGRLKVTGASAEGDELLFSILTPGQIFGELALLGDGRRTASVTALEPSGLLALDWREFLDVLRRRPEVAIELLHVLAERVRNLSEHFEETWFRDLPVRLAKKLLDLADAYGRATPEGLRIELRVSQGELGELVATSRESVNKQMRAWSEAGWVRYERGFVTLRRREALRALIDAEAR